MTEVALAVTEASLASTDVSLAPFQCKRGSPARTAVTGRTLLVPGRKKYIGKQKQDREMGKSRGGKNK